MSDRRTKPEGLKFQYDVGDVVMMSSGHHALILDYGIYNEQYFAVRNHPTDSGSEIRLAGTDWFYPNKSPHIVELETDKEMCKIVIGNFIKEQQKTIDFLNKHNYDKSDEGYAREFEELQFFVDLLDNLNKGGD